MPNYIDTMRGGNVDYGIYSKVLADNIANEYTQKTYAVGDYCFHDTVLYRCNTAITTAEPWTLGHWTSVNTMNEVLNLKKSVDYNYGSPTNMGGITSCDDIVVDSIIFVSTGGDGQIQIPDYPFTGSGWLQTRINSTQKLQIAYPWLTQQNIKYRIARHGVWGNWVELNTIDYDDFPRLIKENYNAGFFLHQLRGSDNFNSSGGYGSIQYNENKGMYQVNMTNHSSELQFFNIVQQNFNLAGLEAGKTYNILLRREDISLDNNDMVIGFQIYVNYQTTAPTSWTNIVGVTLPQRKISFTIPNNAVGILIRFRFYAGNCNTWLALECTPQNVWSPMMIKTEMQSTYSKINLPLPAIPDGQEVLTCADVDHNGVYFNSKSNDNNMSFSDFPFLTSGWLFNYKCTNNNDLQIAFSQDTTFTNPQYRVSHSGVWKSWTPIGDWSENPYLTSCNLDTVLNSGFWLLVDSQTYTNMPKESLQAGFLEVHKSSKWIKQIFYELRNGNIYVRTIHEDQGVRSIWTLITGSNGNTYNITQEINQDTIQNTYNSTISPQFTTDSNGWLNAIDTTSTVESNATDMTSAIMAMLTNTGYCHLGPGIFYVSGNIDMPTGSTLEGCGEETVIRLLSSVTSGYIVRIIERNTIQNIKFSGGDSVPNNFFTDGTSTGSRHGVYCIGNADGTGSTQPYVITSSIHNCSFENFVGSGFYAYNCGGGVQQGVRMSDCYFNHCKVGININYNYEYAKFANCITYRCYWACINNGGNHVFTGCTFHGVVGMLMDNSANDKPNNAHGSIIGCTFNHIDNINHASELGNGDALHVINCHTGEIISGCQFWYGSIIIENSEAIQISDSLFGNNAIAITVTGNYPAFFLDNMFYNQPTTLNVNTSTVFKNNYLRAGTELKP